MESSLVISGNIFSEFLKWSPMTPIPGSMLLLMWAYILSSNCVIVSNNDYQCFVYLNVLSDKKLKAY